jgi:hypothetical protein
MCCEHRVEYPSRASLNTVSPVCTRPEAPCQEKVIECGAQYGGRPLLYAIATTCYQRLERMELLLR